MGTKKTKKSKDKIVVSKLVKSDRPLREKSPEKGLKEGNVVKYARSVSQPAPPSNFHLLLPPDCEPTLSRNLSLRYPKCAHEYPQCAANIPNIPIELMYVPN